MVIYYGYYNNVSRGKRKNGDIDEPIPSILEATVSSKAYRKKVLAEFDDKQKVAA
ncbi:MAG: hypothetical protein QG552_491 [Thermodesulfobacteriota bacterium]|nr:hypothetical protein [Thermodesulfobacteriota bacterium]